MSQSRTGGVWPLVEAQPDAGLRHEGLRRQGLRHQEGRRLHHRGHHPHAQPDPAARMGVPLHHEQDVVGEEQDHRSHQRQGRQPGQRLHRPLRRRLGHRAGRPHRGHRAGNRPDGFPLRRRGRAAQVPQGPGHGTDRAQRRHLMVGQHPLREDLHPRAVRTPNRSRSRPRR
ncbi:hypothetical protein [Lactiplantibacillus plantarum]|uniref:hypothetical protein n=1 Tax=Lactiplantibacillus plantarum TaxID=1590 RepID=UPI004045D469